MEEHLPGKAPTKTSPQSLSDYFEVLSKAVFTSGISLGVVEARWGGLRAAFEGFEPARVAAFTPETVERLMSDARMMRSRAKIEATIDNAAEMVTLDVEHGGFRNYLRSHTSFEEAVSDLTNRFRCLGDAGAAWRGEFGDTGWENVRRHMALNFDATVRLTEALLPTLRRSAPSAIVNVASTAGRVARGNSGGYSASKFALCGWSDALHLEESAHGVHVGIVLPGFVVTEGFPQRELVESARTRWLVSSPEKVAEAIVQTGPGGKAERFVPRPYALAGALRAVAPGLIRRALSGGAAITPATVGDAQQPPE